MIVVEDFIKSVRFNELESGDVFYLNGHYFSKLSPISTAEYDEYANAIQLDNFHLNCITNSDTRVIPCEAELHIINRGR